MTKLLITYIRNSLETIRINFPCVGFRYEDEKMEILRLIDSMKKMCFHKDYTSSNFVKCKKKSALSNDSGKNDDTKDDNVNSSNLYLYIGVSLNIITLIIFGLSIRAESSKSDTPFSTVQLFLEDLNQLSGVESIIIISS